MNFIVNGRPGVGKTSFEQAVQQIMGESFCQITSTIDFVKNIARQCGWNGEKTPNNRLFLSNLKQLLVQWDDVPFKQMVSEVKAIEDEWNYYGIDIDTTAIFIDCREPSEISKLCNALNAKTILIQKDPVTFDSESIISNSSDQDVFDYSYDIIIENNGTLEELQQQALKFVRYNKLKHI